MRANVGPILPAAPRIITSPSKSRRVCNTPAVGRLRCSSRSPMVCIESWFMGVSQRGGPVVLFGCHDDAIPRSRKWNSTAAQHNKKAFAATSCRGCLLAALLHTSIATFERWSHAEKRRRGEENAEGIFWVATIEGLCTRNPSRLTLRGWCPDTSTHLYLASNIRFFWRYRRINSREICHHMRSHTGSKYGVYQGIPYLGAGSSREKPWTARKRRSVGVD